MTTQSGVEGFFELVNASFADVENGTYLPNGTTVIVRDGFIEGFGDAQTPVADAERVDLNGAFVVPGLINPHVHTQLVLQTLIPRFSDLQRAGKFRKAQIHKSMLDCLDRGVTTICDAMTWDLSRSRAFSERLVKEGRGPRVVHSVLIGVEGGTFTPKKRSWLLFKIGNLPFIPFDSADSGVMRVPADSSAKAIREAVDIAIEVRGAEVIKLYDQREKMLTYAPGASLMSMEQLEAAADQCRKRSVASTMHHLKTESFNRGIRAGVTSLAHLADDRLLDPEEISTAATSKTVLIPTISIAYPISFNVKALPSYGSLRNQPLEKIREKTIDSIAQEFWEGKLGLDFKRFIKMASKGKFKALLGLMNMQKVFAYYAGVIGNGVDNMSALYQGGMTLACGNDAGALPVTPSMMGLELELLNEFLNENRGGRRFDCVERLKASTINAAKSIGMEGSIGSIAKGKMADLAIYREDPFQDPEVLGKRVSVLYKDGKKLIDRL